MKLLIRPTCFVVMYGIYGWGDDDMTNHEMMNEACGFRGDFGCLLIFILHSTVVNSCKQNETVEVKHFFFWFAKIIM